MNLYQTKIWLCIALVPSSLTFCGAKPSAVLDEPSSDARYCESTKEFVTALEYLRSRQEFHLSELEAQKLASQVVPGCSGAAQRFVHVSSLLAEVGFPSQKSVQTGIEFALQTDEKKETFVRTFLKCYLSTDLDLPPYHALKIAKSLSIDFDGDQKLLVKDFDQLVDFCLSNETLGLPKPQCANFAFELSSQRKDFGHEGIARHFVTLFDFLTSTSGPNLVTHTALEVAQQTLSFGPKASESFIRAYRYAISNDGLKLPAKNAIDFAQKLSSQSRSVASTDLKK